jgi:hypothetical protein
MVLRNFLLLFLLIPTVTFAAQISVPSAPSSGYGLVSTTTGAYIYAPYQSTYPLSVTANSSGINYSLLNMSTTTATCSGTVSCATFTIIGGTPITITGSGGGSGTVGISSVPVISGLAYWTTTTQTPALLSTVATTSLGVTSPITFSGTLGAQVGGAGGSFGCATCIVSNAGDWAGTWQSHNPAYFQVAGSYLTLGSLSGTYPIIYNNSTGAISTAISTSTITNLPSLVQTGTITSGTWNGTAIGNSYLANGAVANLSGTNTGDNAANSTYASDYRLANFAAGTNYTLVASSTCAAGSGLQGIKADGTTYCFTPASSTYTGTYPIIVTGSVISTGISTSTITALPNLVTTGTITSGTWNGTAISNVYGGTGQDSHLWNGLASVNAGVWAALSTTSMNASITGNAGTATTLATARAINGVNFDGSGPITILAASSTLLANNNTFSGLDTFTNSTSTLFTSTTAWIGTLNLTNDLAILNGGTGVSTIGASSTVATTNGTIWLWQKLDLGAAVYGKLPVANGGTGAATLTGCLTGNGTGAITGSGTCNTSAATVTSVATTWPVTGGTFTTSGTIAWGGISTSSIPVANQLGYWSSASALAGSTALTFNPTGTLLTATNASTTAFTTGAWAGFGSSAQSIFNSTGQLGMSTSTPWSMLSLSGGAITVAEASTTAASIVNINWILQQTAKLEMTGNTTVNMNHNGVVGQVEKIVLCQDGAGSHTVTWASSSTLIWTGHTAPTQTATANECDVYSFITTGATGTPMVFGAATQVF